MELIVFYSWQSDLPNSTNRGFIQRALEDAATSLRTDATLDIDPVVERDTAGVAGSPDIAQTIFGKIDRSAIFVCDVSIINSSANGIRLTPNPNVLIELGYALKVLGTRRIVMVMNTSFGSPEQLPFDLKLKRVVTYAAEDTEVNKSASRKDLQGKLQAAIKAIVQEYQKEQRVELRTQPTLLEAATSAVKDGRPDRARTVRTYMEWLASELNKLNPQPKEGEPDELLVGALQETVPLIQGFDSLADVVSSHADKESAEALYKGFENILKFYYLPVGYSGSFYQSDFDFFKFMGHEMFVMFFAHLMRDERWPLISELLDEQLYVANPSHGQPGMISFSYIAQHLTLLDDIRNHRTATGGQRRISIHADLLKERHETGLLARTISWDDFREADSFLFFYSYKDNHRIYWFPRTYVYLGSFVPRFLREGQSPKGAKRLQERMNAGSASELKQQIEKAQTALARSSYDAHYFNGPFGGFDPKTLALPDDNKTAQPS